MMSLQQSDHERISTILLMIKIRRIGISNNMAVEDLPNIYSIQLLPNTL